MMLFSKHTERTLKDILLPMPYNICVCYIEPDSPKQRSEYRNILLP
jgi:hypothetical protein